MSIKLVVFDLGRVLVRICDGWRHACECAGITTKFYDPDETAQAALHDIVAKHEVADLDFEGFCHAAARHLPLSPAEVKALSNAYLLEPYPGAVELIEEINSKGIETACLSNTNANHWRIMNAPGAAFFPLGRLTHQFASHLMRQRKPNDAIYAEVERVTGIAPESIVFFDDLPVNIAAAKSRGWNAHQIAIDSDPIAQAREHLRRHGVL